MRFRGLSWTFLRVARLDVRSLSCAACCVVGFALAAAAAGPNSKPSLRIEVTVIPSVQSAALLPSFANSLTLSDSAKEIKVEWRELPQDSISSNGQAQVSGLAQDNVPKAVLETFTVVSP